MHTAKVPILTGGMTLREWVLSAFIVINLGTVMFMNRPRIIRDAFEGMGKRTSYPAYLIKSYAHAVGLDNEWQMFGRQSRFDWWYTINGLYSDGQRAKLPLPNQSQRSFIQNYFFDYKEGKYMLNLYGLEELRLRYAHYLCRQYPMKDGAALEGIEFELTTQQFYTMKEAGEHNTHLNGPRNTQTLNRFPCPRPKL